MNGIGIGHLRSDLGWQLQQQQQWLSQITLQTPYGIMNLDGSKPIVICNGTVQNADDLDKAQAKAEQLAHQHQCEAFILKPIRKVAPKRDVVTTDL